MPFLAHEATSHQKRLFLKVLGEGLEGPLETCLIAAVFQRE